MASTKIELAKVNSGEYDDAGLFDSIEAAKASMIDDGDYVASRGDNRWEWGFRVTDGKITGISPELM
jgi:hypothetical protein